MEQFYKEQRITTLERRNTSKGTKVVEDKMRNRKLQERVGKSKWIERV